VRGRVKRDREQLLEEVEAERRLLHEIVCQMQKGVLVVEAASGRIMLTNEQTARIWRYPSLPTEPADYYQSFTAHDPEGKQYTLQERYLSQSITRGEVVTDEEVEILRGDGTRGVVNVSSAPVRDSVGNIVAGVVTFYDITERKEAERELARYAGRLSVLSQQLLKAQEDERRHIARELHDQIGQALTALKINLQALERTVGDPEWRQRLGDSVGIIESTLQQVRDLSLDLRPPMLDDFGLISALRWYVDRQARRTGLQARLSGEPPHLRLSPERETALFRIAQEAVTNIIRHAQATRIDVTLRQVGGRVELAIRDDGAGFDVRAVGERIAQGQSGGLLGMQERIELAGGVLSVESAPDVGTTIHVTFPSGEGS
jgi:PAS domain S-box-containing protein